MPQIVNWMQSFGDFCGRTTNELSARICPAVPLAGDRKEKQE